MSRNIAPLMVDTTSSCGVRTKRRVVRPATARAVAIGPAVRAGAVIPSAGWAVPAAGATGVGGASVSMVMTVLSSEVSRSGGHVGVGLGLGRGPGQGQEHLVERRPAQADVVDLEAEAVDDPHGLGD